MLSTKAMGLFLNYYFLAHNFNEESFVIGKVVKLILTKYYWKDLVGKNIKESVYI